MAIEIERKFLLADDSWREVVVRSIPMRQTYLGGKGISIRVRVAGELAWINIKENRLGKMRQEFEYAIPLEDALELAYISKGGQVAKTRHIVHHAGMEWEIDEFKGKNRGLVVAEIELESENQKFELPPWAGQEVTDQERYYNVSLAKHPYREWRDD
jgi:adenylate cyclase